MDQCKTSSGDSEPSIWEYVYIMLLVKQWMVQLATLYPSVGITGSSRLAVWSHRNLYNLLFCRPGPIEYKTLIIPPPNEVGGGVYWIHLVRLSVCPSVCRRHGFRSISQVCFGISISNFKCMLMVAMGRSLLIFSVVTFKMAAWRPYWIFWFPDSNLTLALNINFKLQRHNTYVYG